MTKQQRKAYDYIVQHWRDNGFAPSYEDIQLAMGLHSKSGVHRIIHELARRGWIAFEPHRARTIVPLSPPQPREMIRGDLYGAAP